MDLRSKQIIDNWLLKIGSNELVLVIGAGFTRNASLKSLNTIASDKIPLWNDLIEVMRKKTGLSSFDALLTFDIYREFFGKKEYEKTLLNSMPDDSLIPSEVHKSLKRMPKIKAIITTNNIDTLLDKTFENCHKVITDIDVAGISENQLSIIYLHGHREYSDSWVFSRNDYDELNKKFPLKTSLCRTLLATYPVLFLGFGYSDQDLHSIMRYVNHTVNTYKPAMLSISVKDENETLIKYWEKLGLSIAISYDGSQNKSLEECLVDTLQYINQGRIENLILDEKLSPGYRNEKSFMESLVEQKFECKKRNRKIIFCDYHESRSKSKLYRITKSTDIVSISAYTAFIKEDGDTYKLIKKMQEGYTPAGSWGLMPTHREWLIKGVKKYTTKEDSLNFLIAGVAGLPHFVDTLSLILGCVNCKKKINVTIIDVCEGPLELIKKFFRNKNVFSNYENSDLYKQVYDAVKSQKVLIRYINGDILNCTNLTKDFFDIVLSHHLVSDFGIDNSITIEKYAENIFYTLKNNGILISAQNIKPDELKIISFQKMMIKKGLLPLDTKSVFDVYDYNQHKIVKKDLGLFVEKETLLTVHKKEV